MTELDRSRQRRDEFERVVGNVSGRVRRALVVRYGVEVGVEASAEMVVWAWEHLDRVAAAANPAGLLYRVGQSAARRHRRWQRRPPLVRELVEHDAPPVDPELLRALRGLRPNQRTAVLLVHGYGFSYRDIAELLDVSEAAVTNHVHRGLVRLRELLEEER